LSAAWPPSIPEVPGTEHTGDYRCCRLRRVVYHMVDIIDGTTWLSQRWETVL
jgi:hypothetical protein